MDVPWMITAYVMIDTIMTQLDHRTDCRAHLSDAEIPTIAVVAAKFFGNHQERAVQIMIGYKLIPSISVSRFNRRLHALSDWMTWLPTVLGEVMQTGEVFVIDSMPVPVCRRVRARRCRKVRGREYCGYCAAKKETFFGWRLHLICRPDGVPVRFQMLPAGFHDLTPIHELANNLPSGARVLGDKADNSADDEGSMLAETGVRLVPVRRANMRPHAWFVDDIELQDYRHTIERVNSQLESMGLQRLRARTNTGFFLKVQASVLALICTNMN